MRLTDERHRIDVAIKGVRLGKEGYLVYAVEVGAHVGR
jgi:hypothetical protein